MENYTPCTAHENISSEPEVTVLRVENYYEQVLPEKNVFKNMFQVI